MSNALLSPKTTVREVASQGTSFTALPTAVLGMVGITQRGPIGEATLHTTLESWLTVYGTYTQESRDTVAAVQGFFSEGGQFLWFNRTVHYTDVLDPDTATAVVGSVILETDEILASGATVLASVGGPYNLPNGSTLTFDDGGGPYNVNVAASAASATATNSPNYNVTLNGTLLVSINGGPDRQVTFTGTYVTIGAATVPELIEAITNSQIGSAGAEGFDDGGDFALRTKARGSGTTIEITGGTDAAVFAFPAGPQTGAGNVLNDAAVSVTELNTLTDTASGSTVAVADNDGRAEFSTVATGAATQLQFSATAAQAELGLSTDLANGQDAAAAVSTLEVQGKYAGAYTDDITIAVTDATSGVAEEFNLQVFVNGILEETFSNVTMDDASLSYVETVVGASGTGSDLVVVLDLDAGGSVLEDRPANVSDVAIVGGDNGLVGLADTDFIGTLTGSTGLYALDKDTETPITLLAVPARITAAVQNAMLFYAEVHRNGVMFAILDSPPALDTQAILDYVVNQALLVGSSEFGAIYYPHVQVLNPNTTVFGAAETLTVPPSGHIAGVMALTDQRQAGGIYKAPAGATNGRLRTIVGFETLPGKEEPETFNVNNRDLLYPQRINTLDQSVGTRAINGVRTLKADGVFNTVAERRGVIFIEVTVKSNLDRLRFENNDSAFRAQVTRIVEKFLDDQMQVGAFKTRNPATAFYVICNDSNNPPNLVDAGQVHVRLGLATQKPAEFIIITVTRDTTAADQAAAG
jgi:phage tail sheath protein FI